MSRNEAQTDLFAGAPVEPAYRPNPEHVRNRLRKLLGQARAAATMPWPRSQANLFRKIVPDMTRWLPDGEAAQWREDFAREMARLDAAEAA